MKAVKLTIVLFMSMAVVSMSAQITKDAYKKRFEMMSFNKKSQSQKVSKESRKQAKQRKAGKWHLAK